MLLSNSSSPENTLYYNGALVLGALSGEGGTGTPLSTLYELVRARYGMSASTLIMSLDWLYLAGAAAVDEEGVVRSCS